MTLGFTRLFLANRLAYYYDCYYYCHHCQKGEEDRWCQWPSHRVPGQKSRNDRERVQRMCCMPQSTYISVMIYEFGCQPFHSRAGNISSTVDTTVPSLSSLYVLQRGEKNVFSFHHNQWMGQTLYQCGFGPSFPHPITLCLPPLLLLQLTRPLPAIEFI